ncbi:MAG TPA: IS21 family transposase [Candidatus Limnocylindrales bacterium]
MKTAREQLDILSAYRELGSFRAAAELCGTTHKTVRRVVERAAGQPPPEREIRPKSTDPLEPLIAEKVRLTDGRMSAKRLLPLCRAAGYEGSLRHLRRAVAVAKADWRRSRRTYRPWAPVPGEHLVIDWGQEGSLHVFCAVLAWSRARFVRFAGREDQPTTLRLLAECFELLGGVPAVVLADRMGCLKGGVVANVVVPAPGYVAFAAHYGFRPDFCEAADPESKGMVEHLVGYAKRDLLVPVGGWPSLEEANEAARAWCAEVNGRLHSEIAAVPEVRLLTERALLRALPSLRPALAPVAVRRVDRLRTVRYGSARYSVPGAFIGRQVELTVLAGELLISAGGAEIARHRLAAPGELSLDDTHYGRPARSPVRAVRPRTAAELAFCNLGPVAEAFLRAAAASGLGHLASELTLIVELGAAHGREPLLAALERALAFGRFRAADVRSILAAGPGTPALRGPGEPLAMELPAVPVRPLAAYAVEPQP